MTSKERDHFTKLCRRILESGDRLSFNERAEELQLFLDAVLPCSKQKTDAAGILIPGVSALILDDSTKKNSPVNGQSPTAKITSTRVT